VETVTIIPLKNLSTKKFQQIRDGQQEAAKVWNRCNEIHLAARKACIEWPDLDDLRKATKGGQYKISSQTIQAIALTYITCVDVASKLRKNNSQSSIRYPYKEKKFFTLSFPQQALKYERDAQRLILPMGRGNPSLVLTGIELPEKFGGCRIVWNGTYHELHISRYYEPIIIELDPEIAACIDLGQIHQGAIVTNTGEALIVIGRGIRSLKRQLNKEIGKICQKQSKCTKGSNRWRKLQHAKMKLIARVKRQIRELRHQGTNKLVQFCIRYKVSKVYIGNPQGVQHKNSGRMQNQRMSQWEFGKDINYLQYKLGKWLIQCFIGPERGTSSRCPVCDHQQKVSGRRWRCRACNFEGHRDIVGAANMHQLAYGQKIVFPKTITYLRAGLVKEYKRSEQPCMVAPAIQASSSRADTRLSLNEALLSRTGSEYKQPHSRVSAPRGAAQLPIH